MKKILEVENLSVRFRRYDRGLEQKDIPVISNLWVSVMEGEIVAVAGSSGSGKSLLAHAILGILPDNAKISGTMRYYGEPLSSALQESLRGTAMALVPQSVAYLDPLMRVGKQVMGIRGTQAKQQALFQRYGLAETVGRRFPFQLSGGMTRRVLVTTAVIGSAKLIIADEPTPGMSQDMAETAMGHFRELADEGAGVLLITHDMDLAFGYADRIAVFYAGTTLEIAPAGDFRQGPGALRHPYSQALWQAIPQNGFIPASGTQPYAGSLGEGCPYTPRCGQSTSVCTQQVPMRELRGGEVRCVHAI
jgi:peptide/nickel transport system ATP-binding protein